MDTRKLLEELDYVVMNGREVPLTNKRLVDQDEVARIIDAINSSLPNELENAKRIVADKERVMMDAQKQAETIIAQAKDYIAKITEESELVKNAQERANEIIANANQTADTMQQNALEYATDVLKYVEENMEGTLDSLRKNRESLMQQQPQQGTEDTLPRK
ncbi:MAG: ATPase [Negativicoccus succinicivorans]|uniref:ATPase n=1 Tax=Negativicoccus succinicivorans TaxID=620903 RepID=UPI0026F05729|nr:ATPase [Negativicoccus succinicivorans]MBS5887153.1 ATPase [Negativicoccus succinicivorans]MDU5027680.1 ATPase [Negativicoccus succinicivorans]